MDGCALARALYAYDATCDGELTFAVGEIITVTNKDTGSSAWWEGEGKSGRGQFPVNYVEVIDDEEVSGRLPAAGGGHRELTLRFRRRVLQPHPSPRKR